MAESMPQIGVKAVFDDAEAQRRMVAYQNQLRKTERIVASQSRASVDASKQVTSAQRAQAQQLSDAEQRLKSITSAQDAYTERTKRAEGALKSMATVQVESGEKGAKAQEDAIVKQLKALRTLRRNMMTFIFFMKFFTKAIKFAWKEIGEAVEVDALVAGVNAMAVAYGQQLGAITGSMNQAAGSIVGDINMVKAAQAGLLADHGRFASEYADLWEAARVAAVTGGGDAIKIFSQLVEALNEADASMVDSASNIYNVESALIRYAISTGRTIEMLDEQEKRQVILNEVQRVTNILLASGAKEALDATKDIDALKNSWDLLTGVLGGTTVELLGFAKAGEVATGTVDALVWSLSIYVGTIFTAVEALQVLSEAMTFTLRDMPADVIKRLQEAMQAGRGLVEEQYFKRQPGFEPSPDAAGAGSPFGDLGPEDAVTDDAIRKYHEFLERILGLRDRYIKQMETLEIRLTQRLEEIGIQREQRLEEIAIQAERKREQLLIKLHRRLEDAERAYNRALERIDYENSRRREKIWERYWNRVRKINQRFMDSIYDAIAARDATAAMKAIRRRQRDLGEAGIERNQALNNLRKDQERELEELRIKLERAREDARRSYDQGIEDLARWISQEQDELERHIEAQRKQIEAWHKWRLKAIADQYKLEYLQAYVAYTGQEQLLAEHVAKMNALWAQMLSQLNLPAIPPPPGTGSGTAQNLPIGLAEGGAFVANKPTRLLVGEGRLPEFVSVTPLGGGQAPAPVPTQSMNVNHMVTGAVTQQVTATIDRGLAGFEGRIQAALVDVLKQVFR